MENDILKFFGLGLFITIFFVMGMILFFYKGKESVKNKDNKNEPNPKVMAGFLIFIGLIIAFLAYNDLKQGNFSWRGSDKTWSWDKLFGK